MSIYLITKSCGYQTCCPNEEAIIGYYNPENQDSIQFYKKPDFSSKKLKKSKNNKHEEWKMMISNQTNTSIKEINETYGNMYYVDGIDNLIHTSNGLWGWDKVLDQENKITWIKVSNNFDIWAPINEYYDYE